MWSSPERRMVYLLHHTSAPSSRISFHSQEQRRLSGGTESRRRPLKDRLCTAAFRAGIRNSEYVGYQPNHLLDLFEFHDLPCLISR